MNFQKLFRILPVITATATISVIMFSGCGKGKGTQLGADIPPQAPMVSLSDILKSPGEYHGKKVVMKGIVSGQCPSLCEFFFTDGAHKVTMYPHGYSFPKLETGRRVTIYAEITSGTGQVVFSALGVKLE